MAACCGCGTWECRLSSKRRPCALSTHHVRPLSREEFHAVVIQVALALAQPRCRVALYRQLFFGRPRPQPVALYRQLFFGRPRPRPVAFVPG